MMCYIIHISRMQNMIQNISKLRYNLRISLVGSGEKSELYQFIILIFEMDTEHPKNLYFKANITEAPEKHLEN
jgi:hypothetical protein